MEGRNRISKDEVIAKLKDDGDFDKLRLNVIRKLKDNEDLRNDIIAMVKQSAALNRAGSENMKPRQLSDAIYEDVGEKVMSKVSDGLWEIIRSTDGMKSEIMETVQSVYNKLANPKGKESESPPHYVMLVRKEADSNSTVIASTSEVNATPSENDPKEPPGFSLASNHENNYLDEQKNSILDPPSSHEKGLGEQKEESSNHKGSFEAHNANLDLPPGFSADIEHGHMHDDSDEDPDVPPGFG